MLVYRKAKTSLSISCCCTFILSLLYASLIRAGNPCDQLDYALLADQCESSLRELKITEKDFSAFSVVKAIHNGTAFIEALENSNKEGAVLVLADDISIELKDSITIKKPIILIGNRDNPPLVSVRGIENKDKPLDVIYLESPLLVISGIRWRIDYENFYCFLYAGDSDANVMISHGTFEHTDNKHNLVSNFFSFDWLQKNAQVLIKDNRFYFGQTRKAYIDILADSNHNGSVKISDNEWLGSSDEAEIGYPYAVYTLNARHVEILRNRQLSPKAIASIFFAVDYLGRSSDAVIPGLNVTIQGNQLHPETGLGDNRIEISNAITDAIHGVDCAELKGSLMIIENGCYSICGRGGVNALPELKITVKKGDCPTLVLRDEDKDSESDYPLDTTLLPFCPRAVFCPKSPKSHE
ncbi:MAG: hypothetical protein ACR2PT_18045 [Endozoicomonas sp.]